jgi:hypothetical protein
MNRQRDEREGLAGFSSALGGGVWFEPSTNNVANEARYAPAIDVTSCR